MKVVQIQFTPWDRVYDFDANDFNVEVGDQVVAKTEVGTDIGKVVGVIKDYERLEDDPEIKPILRKVTTEDLNKAAEFESQKEKVMEYCKKAAERHKLEMKIVDAHFSLDGGRLTFAFIADGRVDFRQLVKDLTHYFQKSIRLHQLGIRDEARMTGDFGPCGRRLCCQTHLQELVSITSEMADLQQIAHRGSDRLSGMCGRLRCCLAFEKEEYEKLAANLPPIGSTVKTKQGKGEVVGRHILKQTVDVALDGDRSNIIEVSVH
jgi:cell fate regulator YaaT (PSP1 superfamily)